MTQLDSLFERVRSLNYPASMSLIAGEIQRTAFFPGGMGSFDKTGDISCKISLTKNCIPVQ